LISDYISRKVNTILKRRAERASCQTATEKLKIQAQIIAIVLYLGICWYLLANSTSRYFVGVLQLASLLCYRVCYIPLPKATVEG